MQEYGAEDGTMAPLVEGTRRSSTSMRRREGRWCCRAMGQTGRLCRGMGGGTWPWSQRMRGEVTNGWR